MNHCYYMIQIGEDDSLQNFGTQEYHGSIKSYGTLCVTCFTLRLVIQSLIMIRSVINDTKSFLVSFIGSVTISIIDSFVNNGTL